MAGKKTSVPAGLQLVPCPGEVCPYGSGLGLAKYQGGVKGSMHSTVLELNKPFSTRKLSTLKSIPPAPAGSKT